jgi:hypothetical protein
MKSTAFIQTPAAKLADSKRFYAQLGFASVGKATTSLARVSDGGVGIEISAHQYARTGLKLWAKSWSAAVRTLRRTTQVLASDGGHVASDPSGVRVYLVTGGAPAATGSRTPFGALGKFAGLSIETTDLARSARFWRALGYAKSKGDAAAGWVQMSADNGVDVNLMLMGRCPHLFPNPGLTYFNGAHNLGVIRRIRQAGIPITQEVTCFSSDGSVDNVILQDPGGTGFFIFSD